MRHITFVQAGAISLLALGAGGRSALAQPQPDRERLGDIIAAGLAHPHAPPGFMIIEGDIQVRLDHWLAYLAGGDATFGGTPWPSGIVRYEFAANVSTANRTLMLAAMNDIAQRAGVQFVVRGAGDPNYITIQNSTVNNSAVGMIGGQQIMNIAAWNSHIVMVHELYHALGFWHEQSRTDRDTFITINTANICGSGSSTACQATTCCMCVNAAGGCVSCAPNFVLQTGSNFYGPYDFDSMMHYGRTAFSCNGLNTITVNPPWTAQWQNNIGQLTHISYLDEITCRGLYPFGGDRWWDPNYVGTISGTMQQPSTGSFLNRVQTMPLGGSLFIKHPGSYSGIGTYTRACTIDSPSGAAIIGN
jgi:hypothetical protein